jgi:hypothetical protein
MKAIMACVGRRAPPGQKYALGLLRPLIQRLRRAAHLVLKNQQTSSGSDLCRMRQLASIAGVVTLPFVSG